MDNLKQKTFRAFAWDLSGKLADQGIGFFISIFLARLLAPEEFGLLAMAAVVISLAQVLIDSGLGTALIQRKDVTDAHYGSVFFFNVTVGSLLTLVFFLLAEFIANFYNRPELKPIMQALSFNFIINSFARVQSAWLTKQLKFKVITQARILSVIIGGGTGVTLAFMGYGVWALVIQSLISGVVANTFISIFAKWRPKLIYSWKALKELWSFGGYILVARIFNTITEQLDKLIIGKMFSPATLGYFYRAQSLNQFVNKYTSGTLMSVLFPTLSSIQNDTKRFLNIIDKSLEVLSLVVFLLVGLLYVSAEGIIVLLFSDKWLPSVPIFKVLMLAGFVYPLSSLFVNIIVSKGNSKKNLKLGLIKQSLLILNLIIGFSFGLMEYLYGYVFVLVLAFLVNIKFAANELEIKSFWFYNRIYKYFFSSIVVSTIIIIFDNYFSIKSFFVNLIFVGSAYIISYLGLIILFKAKGIKYVFVELETVLNAKKEK